MSKFCCYFILFVFSNSISVFAQDPIEAPPAEARRMEVKLQIFAGGSRRTIKRAEVRVDKENFYSDREGKITISIPEVGEGKILVSRFGFEKELISYESLRARTGWIEVYLYPAPPSDNEVFVRGEKRPDVSKKTISIEESSRVTGDDPAQVVKLLPGVQSGSFGTDIAVRGSAPEDSKYFIDNMEVYRPFHFLDDLSVVPEQLLSDVEFYAGGFASQYGDATGGIIVLRTKSEVPDMPKYSFKVNLPMYTALYHERPIDTDSFVATSFRYSYLQYLLPYFLPKNLDATIVPYFGDIHIFYVKKDETGGHTKIMALGAHDGIELAFANKESYESDGRDDVNFYDGFASLGVERLRNLSDGWSLNVTPQFRYGHTDVSFFGDYFDLDYYESRLFVEASKRRSKKEYFHVGIEPRYGTFIADISLPIENDDPLYDYEDAERRKLEAKTSAGYVAAWMSYDQQVSEVMITPGLRYYYDELVGDFGVDPRLALRWGFNDTQILKAAVGQYSRSPDPGQSNETFGNPDIKFERSIHYVLGWEGKWGDRWETDLQLYYKKLFHLVTVNDETIYDNEGSGQSKGVELFVRRNLTERAFGWLSYTYSQTQQRESDDKAWSDGDYDQSHVGTLVGSYKLTATWNFGGRFKYHTGDTYTPVSDAVYNASLDKYQPRSTDSDYNAKRLPNYHQIDLFLSKEFLFKTWKLGVRGGFQYLALTKQVYGKSYNYDYSEETDINSIPPIPYIEFKGEL